MTGVGQFGLYDFNLDPMRNRFVAVPLWRTQRIRQRVYCTVLYCTVHCTVLRGEYSQFRIITYTYLYSRKMSGVGVGGGKSWVSDLTEREEVCMDGAWRVSTADIFQSADHAALSSVAQLARYALTLDIVRCTAGVLTYLLAELYY